MKEASLDILITASTRLREKFVPTLMNSERGYEHPRIYP